MSFILDAIKKSEDERQRSKGPDVYSLQAGAAQRRQPAPAWARVLLLLLAIALLSFIASWLWPRLQDQFAAGKAQSLPGATQQPTPQASQQSLQQSGQQASQERANQAAAQSGSGDGYRNQQSGSGEMPAASRDGQAGQNAVDPVYAQARELQAGSGIRFYASDDPLPPRHLIKELWELPADYQSTVPDLKFSFHVFSKAAEKRTIIINGRRLREGQMITSQMRLRSITDTGVICHHRGQFFHVDVVEKW